MKGHGKNPQDQTKEEKISSLPEKRIQSNDSKDIQNHGNKMDAQVNRMEHRSRIYEKCLPMT